MDLKVEISAKNMEVTERISDYVNKKVAKFDRLLPAIDEVRIDLSHYKNARNVGDRNVAQITIRGKGYILRAEERADDIFTALDTTLDKMQRQIERFKGKREHGRGDGTPASAVVPGETIAEESSSQPVVVRRKEFTLVPMDEVEAVEQMVLLGHENFFIFYNANSNQINVLYRRRDGTYGLIEPKIG
ncbi:MAG TPA: ribosome-associated translation inhibitor RaiA [Leptolinea sp.]